MDDDDDVAISRLDLISGLVQSIITLHPGCFGDGDNDSDDGDGYNVIVWLIPTNQSNPSPLSIIGWAGVLYDLVTFDDHAPFRVLLMNMHELHVTNISYFLTVCYYNISDDGD